jgi:hypothetical protein
LDSKDLPRALQAAWDRYDESGESTINDLANDVDALENKSPALQKALDKFRKEQEDDRKLAGRGDMDAAEEIFSKSVERELKTKPSAAQDLPGAEEPKKWIAVASSSHRQTQRLGRSIKNISGGLAVTLGSKTRVFKVEDTPENRAIVERLKLPIRAKDTEKFNAWEAESRARMAKEPPAAPPVPKAKGGLTGQEKVELNELRIAQSNQKSGIGSFIKSGFEEAKADKEKERGTSGDVAMRLSPDLGIAPFVKKDVAPFLKKGVDAGKALVDIMVDVFSPATKTSSADVDELFSAKGYKEKVMTRATDALDASKAKFDAMPQAEQIAFVDRVKRGQRQPTPELQQTADLMRKWDNRLYAMAKRYRPDLPYLENHNRVLWKVIPGSPQARGASIGGTLSKRPWQGGKGFLRRHVLDDMSEGLALGGVPVTYNPVEMFLLHAQDVMKFVSANRAWEGLKKTGSVEWVRTGRKPPEGYVRISDNIARPYFRTPTGVLAKTGEWYVEDGAARMIENYLSRDYIRTGKFGPVGRGLLALKNVTPFSILTLPPSPSYS